MITTITAWLAANKIGAAIIAAILAYLGYTRRDQIKAYFSGDSDGMRGLDLSLSDLIERITSLPVIERLGDYKDVVERDAVLCMLAHIGQKADGLPEPDRTTARGHIEALGGIFVLPPDVPPAPTPVERRATPVERRNAPASK